MRPTLRSSQDGVRPEPQRRSAACGSAHGVIGGDWHAWQSLSRLRLALPPDDKYTRNLAPSAVPIHYPTLRLVSLLRCGEESARPLQRPGSAATALSG